MQMDTDTESIPGLIDFVTLKQLVKSGQGYTKSVNGRNWCRKHGIRKGKTNWIKDRDKCPSELLLLQENSFYRFHSLFWRSYQSYQSLGYWIYLISGRLVFISCNSFDILL
jgi:hypothetical protein